MKLVVNGDSHTAGAEIANTYAFAEDDGRYIHMGRIPHPDNLPLTWGHLLSKPLKAKFHCLAESASSNQRILRTTREYIDQYNSREELFIVIGWSTWERQEWLIDGTYYQVNASGIDDVPDSHKTKYKQFIADINWLKCTQQAHADIWKFHKELEDKNIKHLFFNCNSHFGDIKKQKKWGQSYLDPYNYKETFDYWLTDQGCNKVSKDSYHYGRDAHNLWKTKILQIIIDNKLVS